MKYRQRRILLIGDHMKKYISEYLTKTENNLDHLSPSEINELKEKITYFNYERLIHLIVTFFFALFTLFFLALGLISYLFLIPFFIGIIFLLFYIPYYFFLENSVQYLYKLYDKVKK